MPVSLTNKELSNIRVIANYNMVDDLAVNFFSSDVPFPAMLTLSSISQALRVPVDRSTEVVKIW
jgi:hypothetical protein